MADEEMYEAQARDWLETVDAPPPRLEVAQIIQTGQRQVRRRRMLAVSGTAAMLAAVAAIPAAVPMLRSGGDGVPVAAGSLPVLDCDMTELPLPADLPALEPSDSWLTTVVAMDPTGRYVLGVAANAQSREVQIDDNGAQVIGPDENDRAAIILWDDGTPTALPADLKTQARDVNSQGVVVSEDWIYRDGVARQLGVPDGYDAVQAIGVNESGDVAGYALVDSNTDEPVRSPVAVKWPASDLEHPRLLPLPEPADEVISSDAAIILDDGTVVGSIRREDGEEGLPYLWDAEGEGHALRLPPTAIGGVVEAARGDWLMGLVLAEIQLDPEPAPSPSGPVSSADAAAAVDGIPDYGFRQARWNLRTGIVELIDQEDPRATIPGAEISLFSRSVGAIADGDEGTEEIAPGVVVREATPFAMPAPEGTVGQPVAISDDGTAIAGSYTVAAEGTAPDAPYHVSPQLSASVPVIWHC